MPTSVSEIVFTDKIDVQLIQHVASDESVMAAARVSTKGDESRHDWSGEAKEGLIRFLMSNRHGTPFEHNLFTFYVRAPIFVYREFHRHRIGWSYNEESGRYKQLEPRFYIPGESRPGMMKVEGSRPGQYEYVDATSEKWELIRFYLRNSNRDAYNDYVSLLGHGVALEVARMCLPVNIFSSMYATCNARSLMAFLSLRKKLTKREPVLVDGPSDDNPQVIDWEGEAFFPSKPQWEINYVANQFEKLFRDAMPITYRAFVGSGYVAP